jgi:hypothetical protein
MEITQVDAENHARALDLENEFDDWQSNRLSSSDFLHRISAKRGSGASANDRQRANQLEKFVIKRKV